MFCRYTQMQKKNDRPFQLEVLMTLGFISAVSSELEAVWDPFSYQNDQAKNKRRPMV